MYWWRIIIKVLVGLGHPAHVHFFKNAIWKLKKNGHEIKIVSRDKEVALKLLDAYGFEYELYGKHRKNLIGKLLEIPYNDYLFYKVAKEFKPDILTGILNYTVTHVGRLINKPSIIFTDTEHANLANKLVCPFADVIYTPVCYNLDLGKKQIRYNGYHELAYLHPLYFTPDSAVLDELGLNEGERFIILRFVAWDASHDAGYMGISMEMRRRFVSELGKYGRVLITSENTLPEEFEPYQVKVTPEKMHDLLYFASLYVGEGGTMATEAGILGTPSVYISSLVGSMGNFEELENKYGLVYSFREPLSAINATLKILKNGESKEEWNTKRKILLDETNDVTSIIVESIEEAIKK